MCSISIFVCLSVFFCWRFVNFHSITLWISSWVQHPHPLQMPHWISISENEWTEVIPYKFKTSSDVKKQDFYIFTSFKDHSDSTKTLLKNHWKQQKCFTEPQFFFLFAPFYLVFWKNRQVDIWSPITSDLKYPSKAFAAITLFLFLSLSYIHSHSTRSDSQNLCSTNSPPSLYPFEQYHTVWSVNLHQQSQYVCIKPSR